MGLGWIKAVALPSPLALTSLFVYLIGVIVALVTSSQLDKVRC